MTIDTKNLRVLAEDCMNREIDFDDVSPNQGSTSCDKLTRAYFRDANPAAILALLDALERKDRLLDSLRKAFELVRKDVLNPEELNALGKLRIEAITKELAP